MNGQDEFAGKEEARKEWHRSAAEAVTEQLRRDLLDGSIPAGSRIFPNDLARRFSLSLVPVREALRHLEAEGLVAASPQRATYAADIGVDELAGVYDLRRIVEPEFARRSVLASTGAERDACRAAFGRLRNSAPHSAGYYAAHRDFHWSLLAPAAKPVIRKVLERLWQSVDRYMALGVRRLPEHSSPEYINDFFDRHAEIASAFCDGDADLVCRLLTDHFNETELVMRNMFDRIAQEGTPAALIERVDGRKRPRKEVGAP